MKYVLGVIILVIGLGNEINKIAKINELKKQAKEAYLAGDFTKAIEAYQYLVDSFQVKDDLLLMNLANAYYNINDTSNAISNYKTLTQSDVNEIRSLAYQQLGIMKSKNKDYKNALQDFKQSLKANPSNEDARYNYELLKKILKEQEQQQQQQQQNQQQQDQNKDQEGKQDQQNQEQQNQEQQEKGDKQDQQQQNQQNQDQEAEQKEQQQQDAEQNKEEMEQGKEKEMPSTIDKLKEMNISEEKARMILEAMKNNEIQYIQQNKRKAKNRRKSGKPDW